MDYEKKYREVLKKAEAFYYSATTEPITEREVLANIFLEIKESEDERIRKGLICFLETEIPQCEARDKYVAWLEKQGNKPFDYENANIQQKDFAPKQEPKFKVGDFIVNDYCMGKVIALTDDAYLLDTGQGIPFSCEHNAHLWTIEDAKDGDVLVDVYGNIGIFEKRYGYNWHTYCYLGNEGRLVPEGGSHGSICYPATKEQRDLLFQKMKEAGYEWDAEKLEPIKVPKTKEPEGALKKLLDEQDKFYKEAKIVLEDKDTALAFLRRTGIIDEYGELSEKYRSDQTPATTISAVNGANSTAITDGNTSVTSKEVEKQYCTGQYEPDVREFPIEWKEENVDELSEFELAMMHIGGSFFGEKAGLDPNNTNDVKEQAKFLLELAPKQEWSEEDEYNLLSAIKKLEKLAENEKRVAERDNWERTYVLIDWIKSLKDKIQSLSRPKEWSEEDERMRQYVVNDLMCVKELVNDPNYAVSVESVEKEIDWMESLKERIG